MKRLILTVCAVLMVCGTVSAAEVATATDTTVTNGFKLSDKINFNGDTIYLPIDGAVAIGVGCNIGTFYKDIFEIRAEYVKAFKDATSDKAGIGVGINIVKLLKTVGVKNVPDINTSMGVLMLLDVQDRPQFAPAIYITIIKVAI